MHARTQAGTQYVVFARSLKQKSRKTVSLQTLITHRPDEFPYQQWSPGIRRRTTKVCHIRQICYPSDLSPGRAVNNLGLCHHTHFTIYFNHHSLQPELRRPTPQNSKHFCFAASAQEKEKQSVTPQRDSLKYNMASLMYLLENTLTSQKLKMLSRASMRMTRYRPTAFFSHRTTTSLCRWTPGRVAQIASMAKAVDAPVAGQEFIRPTRKSWSRSGRSSGTGYFTDNVYCPARLLKDVTDTLRQKLKHDNNLNVLHLMTLLLQSSPNRSTIHKVLFVYMWV